MHRQATDDPTQRDGNKKKPQCHLGQFDTAAFQRLRQWLLGIGQNKKAHTATEQAKGEGKASLPEKSALTKATRKGRDSAVLGPRCMVN